MVVGKGLVERGSAKGGAWGVAFPKMTRNCLPATLEVKHVELVTGKEAQRLFVPFLGYSLEGERNLLGLNEGNWPSFSNLRTLPSFGDPGGWPLACG